MIYFQLLYVYLKVGFFGFGGGYSMLSLIFSEIVVKHQWLTDVELTDITAISQMTPGPIAINSATYVGYTITGSIWGAILATVAVCMPCMTLMILLARFYLKLRDNKYISSAMEGMKPMVIAMIASAALLLLSSPETCVDHWSWIILIASFVLCLLKVNPILLIVLSGLAGFLIYG